MSHTTQEVIDALSTEIDRSKVAGFTSIPTHLARTVVQELILLSAPEVSTSTELATIPEPLKPAVLSAKPQRLSHYMIGTKVRITVTEAPDFGNGNKATERVYTGTLSFISEANGNVWVDFAGRIHASVEVQKAGGLDYTVETLE